MTTKSLPKVSKDGVAEGMTRLEEAAHLHRGFRQFSEAGKLNLVAQIRGIAINFLLPVIAKIPRPMSDYVRKAYQEKGVSLKWDLKNNPYDFCHAARKAGLSSSQKNACDLLYHCSRVLEDGILSDTRQEGILDNYGKLDLDDVKTGKRRTKTNQKISSTRKAKLPDINENGVLEKVRRGVTLREIAGRLGCSQAHLSNILKRHGGAVAVRAAQRKRER